MTTEKEEINKNKKRDYSHLVEWHFKKGHTVPKEWTDNLRKVQLGNKNCVGRKYSNKTIIKFRTSQKKRVKEGRHNMQGLIDKRNKFGVWNKGLTMEDERVRENVNKLLENRKELVVPFKDTKIEIKIQDLLKQLHIEFITHFYLSDITHSYQCDILIPSLKIIIEADGCYWHGCPTCCKKINEWQLEHIERDKIRTKELLEKGYRVIRLWEHEIKKLKLNELKEKIK